MNCKDLLISLYILGGSVGLFLKIALQMFAISDYSCGYSSSIVLCNMFLCFRYFQTQRKPCKVALL